jgi:hypothetical protein
VYRLPMLIAAATIAAGFSVTNSFAQNATFGAAPPANLHPPINLDADTLRGQLTPGQLGLKPQSRAGARGFDLPFGLTYNRDAKGLVMSLDEKSEWGVGVGLNINSVKPVELSPGNTLGLQPKPSPGLMLHKKF